MCLGEGMEMHKVLVELGFFGVSGKGMLASTYNLTREK
jgi:hypothetical protein